MMINAVVSEATNDISIDVIAKDITYGEMQLSKLK